MSHQKFTARENRKKRIRKKISGTTVCPRLTVFKSNKHLYAQIIDDSAQATLVSAGSIKEAKGCNKKVAAIVGQIIAEKAKAKQITNVAFDRNGYHYHGVIKELADAARKAGLKF